MLPPGRRLPGDGLLYGFYNRFGESVPFIGLARAAAAVMRGRSVEATRRAGKRAVEPLMDLVQPWALEVLAVHQAEGRPLVMATTSPVDLVPPWPTRSGSTPSSPPATASVTVATREGSTGRSSGAWARGRQSGGGPAEHGISLAASHAYSDSFFDLPLLRAVGHPHPVNADPRLYALAVAQRWPLENWDRPPGIPSLIGYEPYHLARLLFRPEAFPYARFRSGGGQYPESGSGPPGLQPPELLRCRRPRGWWRPGWAGRSASWPSRRSSTPRWSARWPGRSAVSRSTGAVARRTRCAGPPPLCERAKWSSSYPQGTIPRGEAFFDRVLTGRTGAARLAAETGAPVIPVGLWGTEDVWPRARRFPHVTTLAIRRRVTVTGRPPCRPGRHDAVADTASLMAAIVDLLPAEARAREDPDQGRPGPHPTVGVTVDRPSGEGAVGRSTAAVGALRLTNWLSRSLGRGSGTVVGGRVGLVLDPSLLGILAQGRGVALVSGTNGKTTTTRLLAAALTATGGAWWPPMPPGPTCPPVMWPPWSAPPVGVPAVLEVDEGYLGQLIEETRPRVVLLLNLSRDQLDRISEVRMMVERWRQAAGRLPRRRRTDRPARWWWPMLTIPWWCERPVPPPSAWVGAGQVWRQDAAGCPVCGGGIDFGADGHGPATVATSRGPDLHAWLVGRTWCSRMGRGCRWTSASRASSIGPTRPWLWWPPR